MKKEQTLLVGNGININFGGKAYSNQFIIKRIVMNAKAGKYDRLFERKVTGEEIASIFLGLADLANEIVSGKYDSVVSDTEQDILEDFKNRYSKKVEHYYDVGLEDWLFILHAFFLKNDDLKNEWVPARQGFERMMLDAIYNDGDIQNIYKTVKKPVKRWLCQFDNIFSLNYDNNVEKLTKKTVHHLHGDYETPANSENKNTLLGYIRAKQNESVVIEGFEHCYCNALFDYTGEHKLQMAESFRIGKEAVKKLAEKNIPDDEIPDEIKDLIQAYREHPEYDLGSDYHFSDFRMLKGELHIIGMSPNNDSHIFKLIDESSIEKVIFYFYSESEKIQKLPIHQKVEYKSARELWRGLKALPPQYNCRYSIPHSIEAENVFKTINKLSGDPISKGDAIKEFNSIPQFRVDELCEKVKKELDKQGKDPSPRDEGELLQQCYEISKIALRNGVQPVSLYFLYIMNTSK